MPWKDDTFHPYLTRAGPGLYQLPAPHAPSGSCWLQKAVKERERGGITTQQSL
jgi:hypothetical protein